MLGALHKALGPERLRVTGEHTDFHLVWWPPPEMDVGTLQKAAAERGLRFQMVADFCKPAQLPPGLVFGYAALNDAALRRHVDELGGLIARF